MRYVQVFLIVILLAACSNKSVTERTKYFPKQTESLNQLPDKQNVWVFILAGQSNMAGRGLVEPKDTVADKRILAIDKNNQVIIAKEPLHWYEPERTGLDCGYSFAKAILKNAPSSVSVLIIPTAIGGSAIRQWIGDSLYRNVKLLSNFTSKVEMAKQYGVIKAVLWHQGESDANEKDIPHYKERLGILFGKFRSVAGDSQLPILLGELGSFSKDKEHFSLVNKVIHDYSAGDKRTAVIPTGDLKDRGDSLHFDSKGQRMMGERFAHAWLEKFNH